MRQMSLGLPPLGQDCRAAQRSLHLTEEDCYASESLSDHGTMPSQGFLQQTCLLLSDNSCPAATRFASSLRAHPLRNAMRESSVCPKVLYQPDTGWCAPIRQSAAGVSR